MTLPIILALESADKAEREIIVSALGNPNSDAAIVEKIVTLMNSKGILETTLAEAEKNADAARKALDELPQSEMRDLLSDIAGFCLLRAY